MSTRLLGRVKRLEQQQSKPSGSAWDALMSREIDLETFCAMMAPTPEESRAALEDHPALRVLRRHWARLGIPDPGEYGDIDVIEEAIRLAGVPGRDGGMNCSISAVAWRSHTRTCD
jgi:hypothetical protein